jgi:hypothetical protein
LEDNMSKPIRCQFRWLYVEGLLAIIHQSPTITVSKSFQVQVPVQVPYTRNLG